jgi:hypothetical protein
MSYDWRSESSGSWFRASDSGVFCMEPTESMTPDGEAKKIDHAEWVEKLKAMPAIRKDLVYRLKAEIESGEYYSEEKWEQACARMRDELLGEG